MNEIPEANEPDTAVPAEAPRVYAPPSTPDPSSLTPHPAPLAALQRTIRLARKELREILRDRRTIVTLIAMPLLLYPLMAVAFQQFYLASSLTSGAVGPEYRFGALTQAEHRVFQERFERGQNALLPPTKEPRTKESMTRFSWDIGNVEPRTAAEREARLQELKKKLRAGEVDLIVAIPDLDPKEIDPWGPRRDRFLTCQIYALPSSGPARGALNRIEAAFAAANELDLKNRLNVPGVWPRIAVLHTRPIMLETPGGDGVIPLRALVPLVLILMTITGAVYPAIDLTAGERERGTLEILVAAPVARFELLAAKYFSVVTVAVLNAVVNLACMTITVKWSGLSALLGDDGLSPILLLQVLGLLLLFGLFFSAVLLCLTSFARSFKEAQAYLIPLMLASLAPGVMAMMPGLELNNMLAVTPLVNVVLLARDLFGEGIELKTAAIVILTTLLYALAALSLAARVFGEESVLYSEQGSWGDLLRRPDAPQPTASIPAMLWCLAMMVPVQFAFIALMRSLGEVPPMTGFIAILLANLALFGALPAAFVFFGRVKLRSGAGLFLPRWAALVGAVLLGVSLWPWQLWLLAQIHMPGALEERFNTALEEFQHARANIGWTILMAVVVPAILEEFFFRGLLFNALKARSGPLVTIGTTSVLFGMTHVILSPGLGMDRLYSSTALGLTLGVICWHTGSVWPSLIQHGLHNAILLTMALYEPGTTESIPLRWLANGAVGAAVGVLLIWRWGKRQQTPLTP